MEPSKSAATPLTRALDTIKSLRAQLDAASGNQPLAVVGVGLRLPGGIDDLDSYWAALESGRDLVRTRPPGRMAPFADEWAELPHQGSFLDEVLGFDADFFGISPREARAIDPQHRLLLEVAHEALEDAALAPEQLTDAKVGVFVGITGRQDYRDWNTGELDAYWATGNGHSFAAGRISYCLGLTGPAVAVDTACSSSLVAIHQAGQALRRGECEVALAGGVNLVLAPGSTRIIDQTRSLSPDGRCKSFDARANGFVRGEGCGVIALKRLDHALRDGDRIHGVIRGSAINQDGRSSGFTAPNVLAQIDLLESALADAGLTPADLGLIEAHGTGTSLGDPIEMDAIIAALGRRNEGAKLHVGSVKANLGHLEGAAGIAGVIKALLCLRKGVVPPLVHFETLNPRIDLDGTGISVSGQAQPWRAAESGRYAGVSSFGMIGTNAHIIVGPAEPAESAEQRATEVPVTGFQLSAKTPAALRALAGRLAERLATLAPAQYAAFAYTVTEGRSRQEVTATVTAADPASAAAALGALAADQASPLVTIAEGTAAGRLPALPRRVVELPHYPWERTRHAPAAAAAQAAPAAAAAPVPAAERPAAPAGVPLHELAWHPVPPTAPVSGSTLVLAGDDVELLTLLAAEAEAGGQFGVLLGPVADGSFPAWEQGPLPADDLAWGRFWAARDQRGPLSLVLAHRADPLPERLDDADPAGAGAALLAAVTTAVRSLAVVDGRHRAFALTRAVRQVTGQDGIAAGDHGLLHGLLPVLGLEFGARWGGVIDLPAAPTATDARTVLELATAAAPTPGTAVEDLLAVRDGAAFGARLRPVAADWQPELTIRQESAYLITGGAGGIGRALAADLVRRGARHLVLIGRTAPEALPATTRDWLAELAAAGVAAHYRAADCDRHAELTAALAIEGLPPIAGVIHAAGTLPLAPLAEADSAAFEAALRGKYSGAWWLHLLSRDWPLDFFLQTSSASGLWGNEGRGAYAAANGGLDALAAHRAAAGLPASSLAFGAWALDGMADEAGRRNLARMGLGEVDPATGCTSLTAATPNAAALLLACPVDWPRFLEVIGAGRPRALFAELAERAATEAPPSVGSPLRGELLALPEGARLAAARVHVGRQLAAALGYAEGRAVPEDVGFYNLGLDSIMAVDLARELAEAFAVELRVAEIFSYPTVGQLAELIAARLADGPKHTPAAARSPRPRPAAAAVEAAGSPAAPAAPVTGLGEPIAIVGMAARYPGADSVEEFWQLLAEARDAVGPVPADRWDRAALHDADPLATGTITTDQGGFLSDLARFDAGFFGIPAREAESLDPQHRLLLEAAWHALEDGGIDPHSVRGSRTGVFVGISNSDYARLLEQGGLGKLDAYFGTGTALNAAAGRISYLLGANGPALAVDTACSSSLVALHLAVRSLRSGESDRALAGGVNVIADPSCSVAVSRAHMLSPEGRCKTFSAEADGFVRAEGCGVLVLKRLSDAERDGDRVLAVIHGTAVNQDGASSGLTVPSGRAQEAVINEALADAGLDGAQISYLEAHGTGTSLGDPIELAAAWAAFGPGRRPGEPLQIGSVKSNIGHSESASGIAGVIKTVLALRHRKLPASLHAENLNPHVPWDDMNLRVVDALTPWRTGDRPRLAAVSSFGFSGTNAQVILGEAAEPAALEPAAGPYLLPLSAPDLPGLARLSERWEQRLAEAAEHELAALAVTAGTGRAHFGPRRALLGAGAAQLLAGLREPVVQAPGRPTIAFLFTGMGSQYFGMGRELYESEPVFRQVVDRCDEIIAPLLGLSLLDLMFYGADEQLIDQVRFIQPTTVVLELALVALWESWGVRASVVTGHSVGEIAAAIHAGVLDLVSGLTLVAHRARLMQERAGAGSMLSVAAPLAKVEAWTAGTSCDIAAINGPESIVVAGLPADVAEVERRARAEGHRARSLVIPAAAHSRLIDGMLADFAALAAPMTFNRPTLPVVSNLTGKVATDADYDARYWSRHLREPVRFHDGVQQLAGLGVDAILEIGPGRTLVNMVVGAGLVPAKGAVASLSRGTGERASLLAAAAHLYRHGQDLDWASVQRAGGPARAAAPRYPFADTRYWTKVEPAAGSAVRAAPLRHWGSELRSPALRGRAFAFERSDTFPPYLTDHRIEDTVLTPASSHLATMLSALAGDGSPLALEDFICPRPLVIKDGERYDLQILLGDDEADPSRVSVHSLLDPQAGTWVNHLSGKMSSEGPSAHAPDREAFAATAERHISGDAFYAFFRELGYNLGQSFRWIADIWLRGDEALVRYAQPPLPDAVTDYQIYPGLIDSVFQSIAGFMVEEDAEAAAALAIPFASAKLAFPGRPVPGEDLWGHVTVLQSETLERGRRRVDVADLHLFTSAGDSVIVAEGFRVRAAARTTLRTSLRGGVPHAYELSWVPRPLPTVPQTRRTLVVTGADSVPAGRLGERLRALGHQVNHALAQGPGATELLVDARFSDLTDRQGAEAARLAAMELAAALKAAPADVPYALPVDGRPGAAPVREALFGLLAALEIEQPDRRLVRITLAEGWQPEPLAQALLEVAAEGVTETRLSLGAAGLAVARLLPAAGADTPHLTGGALLTGGLGALGLSVARFLARQGVTALTLMGRSAPDAAAREVIAELTASGVRIEVVAGDVTDRSDVCAAVATAESMAPLSAVFHLAGTTADRAFDHLTEEDYRKVFAAKAAGADTLASVLESRELSCFVLFSSAAGTLGSAGQVNYGAANGYLDGLAQQLRERGVPATAVAWGPWVPSAKGGMADSGALSRAAERFGVRVLSDEVAVPLLALATGTTQARLLAMDADFTRYAGNLGTHPGTALLSVLTAERPPVAEPAAEGGGEQPRGWLREELAAVTDEDDREERVREVVRKLAGDTLGDPEAVEDETGFEEIGLDSIMAIDLSALLAHAVGEDLPATASIDYPNVAEMSRYLTGLLAPAPAATAATPVPDELGGDPFSDDELSDDELLAAVRRDLAMDL
ncbi:acyl transferase domain-containing protein/acyl carrier protein [Kitasatospora sp. GAS204A]|uniref:type I polyketide synthase n=1 Tax=unclassified Kitasatospora TaxID=2633591 RepID=UPI002474F49B|nr:type I polyketide synthase [Kitasatospora sp. GAS204B]MDH6120729.1 acyl transferase domain-containing protein/acyl carrier protein [Kitasatospora sp. GAS204B]